MEMARAELYIAATICVKISPWVNGKGFRFRLVFMHGEKESPSILDAWISVRQT